MGGLVLDIFIVYPFRVLIRAWRRLGTSEWELRKATVASVSCPPIAWGCPIVEVVYLYKIDEMTYSGSANIPFIWRSSANEYARKHPQESILEVRIKPGDPEISVMRAEDQARAVAQMAKAGQKQDRRR